MVSLDTFLFQIIPYLKQTLNTFVDDKEIQAS